MDNKIITAVKNGLKGFEIGAYFIGCFFENYPYYEYFNSPNIEVRKYSNAVYMVKLGNWRVGCAFPFYSKQEELARYTLAFIENKDTIRSEFPSIYLQILNNWRILLEMCDEGDEHWEINIPSILIEKIRKEIDLHTLEDFLDDDDLIRELNI